MHSEATGMTISPKTIKSLVEIITGNSEESPYRSGPQLIEFFREFGERDLYGQGFPSRATYVEEKLTNFNGTTKLEEIIPAAFDFFDDQRFNCESAAEAFNRKFVRDGYRLVIEYRSGWMEGDRYVEVDPYFAIRPILTPVLTPDRLIAINSDALQEQISKAKRKVADGDFAGAIASSYTLTEQLLKLILHESGIQYKESEGDIRELYRRVREPLNLNPGNAEIARPLKPILDGIQKLISGLYEISNKASDRHARLYDPASHHAKLAVNAAFIFCEFLVESRDYQRLKE